VDRVFEGERKLRRTPTIKQREHHEWAKGIGIIDAIAVPIHYPGGDLGLCVSIANRPIADTFERDALQMVSLFTYQRCRMRRRDFDPVSQLFR
jgi:hypothetical protein